ncbi:MAG: RNA polymerase sigma-70 factor [Bacteroidetes bacterium]|jgi:RNA polymerase sigma-70 factor (ECF subfamily)|nr:RNA polymerase sigma-70 factor [Bacteroidota bacterium]
MTNNNNNHDDQFWIENIQSGDERAFEILFKKYYLPLTRFVWRYVSSKAIAEELIQELFTILWEKRDEWDMDTEKSIRSYLYKSARNLALNHIKHHEIKDKYDSEWMEQKENPEINFRDEYREERIRKAIAQAIEELPPRGKMTYKLHRYDGLTYQEIADVMDVSVKTVESQMTRTLKTLRERLSYLLPFLMIAILAG